MRGTSFVCTLAAVAFGVGCNASGAGSSADRPLDGGATVGEGSAPLDRTLPCAVSAILAANCRTCHSDPPQFGAGMPLVSFADLHAPAKSNPAREVYELIPGRISADVAPMPPPPNARLSDADRATLTSWAGAGAPEGGGDCSAVAPAKPVDIGVTCTPDLSIGPATPYAMPAESADEYVCYGVELSPAMPTHVTAFSPRIDNTKIVHHVVLFEADAAFSSTPAPCSPGGSFPWRMVMGWAPGGKGLELPPEAGFALKTAGTGTTHYVVQMHYSNPQGLANQTDTSGFDLCTAPPRPYEADVLAFGTQSIDMPANQPSYVRDCSITVPAQLAGAHLLASMPHMHELGTGMSTTLHAGGAGGAATDLGTISGWSFDTQAWIGIKGGPGETGAIVHANDVIETRCMWKNTTGSRVVFGSETADEMCYSFTVYYPKVSASVWSWAAPAVASTCE